MDIFLWILLGAIAGFMATTVFLPGEHNKLLADILGGMAGAIFGRLIAVPLAGGLNFVSLIIILGAIAIGIILARFARL